MLLVYENAFETTIFAYDMYCIIAVGLTEKVQNAIPFHPSLPRLYSLKNIVWRGVVWRGVVWCGVAWYEVLWRGVVWSSVAWRHAGLTEVRADELSSLS